MNTTSYSPIRTAGIIFDKVTHYSLVTIEVLTDNSEASKFATPITPSAGNCDARQQVETTVHDTSLLSEK